MKTHYELRTSRGAIAPLTFASIGLAQMWLQNQRKKHGQALPQYKLIEVTVIRQEKEIEMDQNRIMDGTS